MLLRNYDNLMLARRMPIETRKLVSNGQGKDGYINVSGYSGIYQNGAWCYDPMSLFEEYTIDSKLQYGASCLWCGDGNNPVTYDDTSLSNAFTTNQISSVSGTAVTTQEYNEDDKSWTFTYSRVLSAKEIITIREIGVYSGYYSSDKTTSSYAYSALVYRKVLDTPIELQAGDMVKLSLTMTFPANPNKPADYNASATLFE